jgi:glycosyltransferase involved in cell wall biosynthesis
METVSIIISTYNRKNFVKNAIKSALIQTYPKKEIIVVDDNSDYDIVEELRDFKDKITIIKNKKHNGVASASNKGFEACSGAYITFLDDDDIFHPKKIERQMKIFNKNSDIGLVYCPIGFKINNEIIYQPLIEEKKHWIRITHQNIIGKTPLIKKECLSVCGVFDTSLEYHEDRDLWYRIGKKFQIGFDKEPSYIVYNLNIYRLSSQLEKICSSKKVLYEKYKNDFEDENRYFADYHYELAYEYLIFDCYRKFLRHFIKSIEKNPSIITKYLEIPLQKIKAKNHRMKIDRECEAIIS